MPTAPPDRLPVHLIWEGVLAVIVVVLLVALFAVAPGGAFGATLANVVQQAGYTGLVAAGFALSLRAGAPNLAVGALGVAAGAIGAHLVATAQWPVAAAMAVGVLAVTVIGAVIGLVAGALSVPAWAVTFGAAFVVLGTVLASSGPVLVPLRLGAPLPGAVWFVLFLLVSLGGAALWRVPAVRALAVRTDGDPGRWAGWRAALAVFAALTGSSLLAAIGGVGLTLRLAASSPTAGDTLTLAAVAAVLLGGTSVFGRRAGIAGTVLGVLAVELVQTLLTLLNTQAAVISLVTGLLLIAGLGVSRLLESVTNALGSPAAAPRTT